MFCKNCGTQFEGNFCPKCAAPANEQVPQQNPVTPTYVTPIQKPKKPIFKKWWFWVIIVVVLLLIIIIANSGGGDTTNTSTTSSSTKSTSTTSSTTSIQSQSVVAHKGPDFYKFMVSNMYPDKGAISVDDTAYNFMVANEALFPATTAQDKNTANNMVDTNVLYGNLAKDITPYKQKMVSFEGTVSQAISHDFSDQTAGWLLVQDSDGNYFEVFISGKNDIIQNDYIQVVGLPLAMNSFSNTGNGTTITAAILGCYAEKVSQDSN